MVVVLLGGSFVGNWTDEVVAWIRRHMPTATIVATPPDFPTFPAREDARLARFALLRHRASALRAATLQDDVVVCVTSYDVQDPDDPRVEALLSRLATTLVPPSSLADARVVVIEEPPHESYARRMASGSLMTYASSSAAADRCGFGYLSNAAQETTVRVQAPSYAAHTPRLLDTVLRTALGV